MKILLLLNAFEPDGPTTLTLDLARGLRLRHGMECEVAALSRGGPMQSQFKAFGIPSSVIGSGWRHQFHALESMLREGRYDVLHTHLLRADLLGRWMGERCGVPLIVSTEHGIHTWSVLSPLLKPLFRKFYLRTSRAARAIVAVSDFVRSQLLEEGLPGEKIVVIPNGVDLTRFRPISEEKRQEIRNRLGISPEATLAVAVGKMVPLKDHLTFCRAMKLVREQSQMQHLDIQAAIVGDGPALVSCREYVRCHELEKTVQFVGERVGDVEHYIAAADVLVQPSRMESFGLAVVQAMACGVPVVASRVGGLVEIIQEDKTGYLVESGDTASFANKILQLAQIPSQRTAMGEAAFVRAHSQYNVEQTADAYARLYRKLMTVHSSNTSC